MPKPSQKHSTAFWLGTVARAADLLKPRNLIKDAVFWRCKVIFLNSKSINPKYSKQYSLSYFVHWRRKHVNHLCFLKRCCWPQNTGKLFEFSAYLISKIQILRIKRFFPSRKICDIHTYCFGSKRQFSGTGRALDRVCVRVCGSR